VTFPLSFPPFGDYGANIPDDSGWWSEAAARIPAPLLSFMSESRRLSNARLKRDFGYVLRYPTVMDGLRAAPVPLPVE